MLYFTLSNSSSQVDLKALVKLFSMNTTVTATGMQVKATTPANLLINNKTDGTGTWADTTAKDETDSGKLYPASSSDAVKFNAIYNGSYLNNGKGGVAEADTKFLATSGVTAMSGSADGYYVVYDFALKLSEAQEDDATVYMSKLHILETASPKAYKEIVSYGTEKANGRNYYNRTGTSPDFTYTAVESGSTLTLGTHYFKLVDLADAARVGVFYDTTGVGDSFALKGIYAINGASTTYEAISGDVTDGTTYSALAAANKVAMSSSNVVFAAADGTITYADANKTIVNKNATTATLVKLVVWIEGQDASCININSGATFTVDVEFAIKNS